MDKRTLLLALGTVMTAAACREADPTDPAGPPPLQPTQLCGGATDVATFEDPALEASVRAALAVGPEAALTCGVIGGLTSLDATQTGVASLVGIQNLTGLTRLMIGVNPVSDVRPLAHLDRLQSLGIYNTKVIDVSPLTGLTSLSFLDLRLNRGLSDLRALLENPGVGSGDTVDLVQTAASCADIAALVGKGVTVRFDEPTLSPSYLDGGYLAVPYADAIEPAVGCHGEYTYTVTEGSLPEGLSLDAHTGAIRGAATRAGMSFFVITATGPGTPDSRRRLDGLSASAAYTISVSTNPPEGFNLWGVGGFSTRPVPSKAILEQLNGVIARWEALVTSELPDVRLGAGVEAACATGGHLDVEGALVDDVLLFVAIRGIDGAEGKIGGAGPCWFSESPPFTIVGSLVLDFYEVVFERSIAGEDLYTLLWHELAHAMGIIDRYWNRFDYLVGEGEPDPRYVGPGAVHEYSALLGSSASSVELEDRGGPGTRDTHWRESVFATEMMTPRLNKGVLNPVSRMTLRALEDVGWGVDLSLADPYVLPSCAGSCPRAPAVPGVPFPEWELVLDLPGGTQEREP